VYKSLNLFSNVLAAEATNGQKVGFGIGSSYEPFVIKPTNIREFRMLHCGILIDCLEGDFSKSCHSHGGGSFPLSVFLIEEHHIRKWVKNEKGVNEEGDQKLRMAVQAFESENIYFDFDKSDLKPEARAILDKKADWLRANAQYRVRIEGHGDERGTNEYNLALGERRAEAAMRYLAAQGVSADRLSTISYGEERPTCTEKTESCWAKNRRAEFKLLK
jgi:peptidoglycan-associated lipoprotein